MNSKYKENLFQNIDLFIQSRPSYSLKNFELRCDVPDGYVERVRKTTVPTIDFAMKCAKAIGVTIDALLNYDFSTLNPREQYLILVLSALTVDTQEKKLLWEQQPKTDFRYKAYTTTLTNDYVLTLKHSFLNRSQKIHEEIYLYGNSQEITSEKEKELIAYSEDRSKYPVAVALEKLFLAVYGYGEKGQISKYAKMNFDHYLETRK